MTNVLDHFKPKPLEQRKGHRMARGSELPPAPELPPHPLRNHVDVEYAEEAKRVAQRHLDQVATIDTLREEADDWRHRCRARDEEIERLKHELQIRELDLDQHKQTLAALKAQFDIVTDVLLKAFKSIDQFSVSPPVNMPALAAAVDQSIGDPVDPMEANKHE